MIIPKGKKFQFTVTEFNVAGAGSGLDFEQTKDMEKLYAKAVTEAPNAAKVIAEKLFAPADVTIQVPPNGYLGNAYTTQDINLNFNASYSKPLEGILGGIPHTFDLVYQALSGTTLSSNRFSNLKFWTGTEPLEISLQIVFETQIDSYYDVYAPVRSIMRLILPEETPLGFYKSPLGSLQQIATDLANFSSGVGQELVNFTAGSDPSKALKDQAAGVSSKMSKVTGYLQGVASGVQKVGFQTNLYIGNNFDFTDIVIKNIQTEFSSELSYAPIHFINTLIGGDPQKPRINPYTFGEMAIKMISQSICALAATANNVTQSAANILKMLPEPIRKFAEDNIGDIQAFPTKATMNITFEMQYPIVRNNDRNKKNSLDYLFSDKGFNRI